MNLRSAFVGLTRGQQLQDAITADAEHYTVEFENDIVRVLRVRLGAGENAPRHSHVAYCAIEISDSSLKEPNGLSHPACSGVRQNLIMTEPGPRAEGHD